MSDVKVAPEGLTVAAVLDARGLSCPMPLLRTKKEIGKIQLVKFCTSKGPTLVQETTFQAGASVLVMSILARKKNLVTLAFLSKKDDHTTFTILLRRKKANVCRSKQARNFRYIPPTHASYPWHHQGSGARR
jgi:TusA-related sulfurtransferase